MTKPPREQYRPRLDEVRKKELARLAERERKTREAALAATEEFRAAVREAAKQASIREVAAASGRSFQRIHQIVTAGGGA